MPSKIANTLSDEENFRLLEALRALSGKPTYAQVQAEAKKFGVTVSIEGAKTYRNQDFSEHLKRLRNGREKSAQILAAINQGEHPLDAVEAAAAADLLDLYTGGETEVDTAAVVKIALQLRSSLEQRKDRDRSDADLARKLRETEASIAATNSQLALRDQQIAKLKEQATERAEKNAQAKAALSTAAKRGGLTKETLKKIEEAAGLL